MTKVFYAIADLFENSIFLFYDNIGNIVNTSLVFLGFFGFFYWMRWQKRFIEEAKNDPSKIK